MVRGGVSPISALWGGISKIPFLVITYPKGIRSQNSMFLGEDWFRLDVDESVSQ